MQLVTKKSAIDNGQLFSSHYTCEQRAIIEIIPYYKVKKQSFQDKTDQNILKFIRSQKSLKKTKINSKYFSNFLNISHNEVVSSIDRLNKYGYKIKRLD